MTNDQPPTTTTMGSPSPSDGSAKPTTLRSIVAEWVNKEFPLVDPHDDEAWVVDRLMPLADLIRERDAKLAETHRLGDKYERQFPGLHIIRAEIAAAIRKPDPDPPSTVGAHSTDAPALRPSHKSYADGLRRAAEIAHESSDFHANDDEGNGECCADTAFNIAAAIRRGDG